jgi:WD40 repeat protein
MILYHELRNYSHSKPNKKKLIKRKDIVANLKLNLESLGASLDELLDIEDAWKQGGLLTTRQVSQKEPQFDSESVATCLEVTEKYIILALDSGKIWIFDHNSMPARILQGHLMGVWTIAIYNDIVVSGGSDRGVRFWNINTGYVLIFVLGMGKLRHTDSYIVENDSFI